MDTVTISRRDHPSKKGNKENTQPPAGAKSFIKTGNTSVVPFQLRGNKREDAFNKNDSLKGRAKAMARKPVSAEAQAKLQRDAKGASGDVKRQTLQPTVAEAPKHPAPVPSSKSAPGMYKGRIVQSKIGSIWKSSDPLSAAAVSKPPAPKLESKNARDMAKTNRSKSIAEVSRQDTKRPVLLRSKSVSDKPHQVTRSTGLCSTRPPARTLTAPVTATKSKVPTMAPNKQGGNQNTKPKIPVTGKKAGKPVVSSTLSQYRVNTETAEEKRAKLAEWLASKGKTLKRPAMTTMGPPKTKVSANCQVEPTVPGEAELHLAARPKTEPGPSLKVDSLEHEIHGPSAEAQRETPGIMNTKLDLLDDSDADLTAPDRVDDIVVNLCVALEAMVTPSGSSDDVDTQCDQPEECKSEEWKDEQIQAEQTREEPEVTDQKMKQEHVEDEESEGSEDEDVMETTPPTDASIIKYSVKTTPYLQSVKKTIEGDVSTSMSRRKSNIKDLKFLTPVRRSSRIQQISSHLPSMLADHDPCVSSLAELVKLDDDPNAYIYRKNPALLQELPDQNTS
uniref:Si:ch211-266i6.3 n=1 Tax=Fundulus heteroclitus TaxID=8078 RepID=A0A3Q2QP97_FUNHE